MIRATEPSSERKHLADAPRAFVLFGVIVINLIATVMALIANEIAAVDESIDLGFATFNLILLQSKARCAFALLFGVDLGILISRLLVDLAAIDTLEKHFRGHV